MDTGNPAKTKKCKYCGKYKLIVAVLFPLGVICLLSGIFSESVFTSILKKKLVLEKGSQAYELWRIPPIPVYMKFYIFNYTNLDDIITRHAKPRVSQIGPFTYREVRVNQVLDYNANNITYIQNFTYVFEPVLSCSHCHENRTVCVPNIALMGVLSNIHTMVKHPGFWVKFAVNTFLNNYLETSIFKQLTVGELIWGYEDDILTTLGKLEAILRMFGFKLPQLKTIQLQRNGTDYANDVGNLTILTGRENIDDLQKVVRWRGMDSSPYWNTKYANMINGSEGAQSPPFVTPDDKLYAFSPQLCRSFFFVYEKEVNFFGIPMYRFTPASKLNSDNVSVVPNSVEFCNDTETCLDGLLSVGRCQFGNPPIFMSSPHFYNSDPKLVDRISGLKPDEVLHKSFIDVEPTVGVTMRGVKRMQVNIMARKSFVELTQVFQHDVNFLPVCYVEQIGVIDGEFGAKFRKMVLLPKDITKYGGIGLMAVASLLILFASYMLVNRCHGNKRWWSRKGGGVDESSVQEKPVQKELLPTVTVRDI